MLPLPKPIIAHTAATPRRYPAGAPANPPHGFALVVTLSLMALLTVLIVGLLSLSATNQRGSSQADAQHQAQANARLAMKMAIGELQKHAGPDMRITAPADILDDGMPPLTGVWRSWEGSDHEATGNFKGRPMAPDYGAKDSRRLSWLVSGDSSGLDLNQLSSLIAKTPGPNSVELVADGSLATGDDRQVHVNPQTLPDGGKFAWWASPENQKARFPKLHEPQNNTIAGWSAFVSNHSVGDPGVFGLDALLVDASPAAKTHTLATADLYTDANAGVKPSKSFHDLSIHSIGLLTNVATGGWRKDLSLLTERWNEQPESDLELFQLLPDESLRFNRPTEANMMVDSTISHSVPNSMPYHWAQYLNHPKRPPSWVPGAIGSWTNLVNWATFYKKLSPTSGTSSFNALSYDKWDFYHRIHDLSVFHKIARIRFIASYYAIPGVEDPTKLIPCLLYTPVVTLWNPYNIEIVENRFPLNLRVNQATPLALEYRIGGTAYPRVAVQRSRVYTNIITDNWDLNVRFENGFTLKPGETKVFSPPADEIFNLPDSRYDHGSGTRTVKILPGFRSGGGFLMPLRQILDPQPIRVRKPQTPLDFPHDPTKIELPAGTNIKVEQANFDNNSHSTCAVVAAWGFKGVDGGSDWIEATYEQTQANTLYPPLTEFPETSLAECLENPKPFLSIVLGARNANHTHQATKGFVQGSPVIDQIQPGLAVSQRFGMKYNYPGGSGLINSPWDYSFVEHTSGPGDTLLPDVDDTTNSGYIISGFQKSDGVPRCVVAHLTTRPISSLGDLTHWNARHDNTLPPFGYNLIGNSDATPLVAADQVHVPYEQSRNKSAQYTPNRNLQYDDSYVLNHLFFDDWFVSSIAPQPDGFGSGGGTFEETYKEFVQGETQLANRAYRAIPEDVAVNASDATRRYEENVEPVDSWKTIASRLEVEGMFNVNSTSVKAWRALLGHARNQKIPYLDDNGNSGLSDPTDHAFPRAGIAGDVQSGTIRPATYAFTTEFTGYRVLDDEMLDLLAEEVVKQVRLRGPFLSLSEFVNRRLTTNASERELALAGAIQAALNVLAEDASLNPLEDLQNESNLSVANPVGVHDYKFPQAGVGHSSYGLPGWPRQADVLRPLAPILSARDDTYTIRAYGESVDANGNPVARAWCEATVRRTKDFVDPAEKADVTGVPAIAVNESFGRRFEVISFRWLNPDEV